jgi:hypothetical protein
VVVAAYLLVSLPTGYLNPRSSRNWQNQSQQLPKIYLPIDLKIFTNSGKYSDTIATPGQPTAEEFGIIKDSGYQLIINLIPIRFG